MPFFSVILLMGLVWGWGMTPARAQVAWVVPADADPATLPAGVKPGMVRYVTQPNGWGRTKEEAIRDLHKRIFPWYQRNFGHRPGFEIDWTWVACVEVSKKRCWQADGRLWWYVEATAPRTDSRHRKMGRFQMSR